MSIESSELHRVTKGPSGYSKGAQAGELVRHPCAPYALAAAPKLLLAAGHDLQVSSCPALVRSVEPISACKFLD